jgi:hypothetical protein
MVTTEKIRKKTDSIIFWQLLKKQIHPKNLPANICSNLIVHNKLVAHAADIYNFQAGIGFELFTQF